VIVKPTMSEGRNAFVDAKAWRADDPRALTVRYEKAAALVGAERIMVQELIPGNGRAQMSYAAVWDRGEPIGSLTARRLRQYPVDFGFTSTYVETVTLPQIEQAACRFLKSLEYSGLVEIEFKYDARDGTYKILDVNTRSWTWIALGAAAGVDFAFIQWQLAVGREVDRISGRPGATWRYLSRDLAVALLEMFAGTITPADCLRSLRHAPAAAVLAWDDPLPALIDLPLVATRVARRRLSLISSIARSQLPARTASASRQ
jgi:D-aspartate ligase